MPTMLWTLSDSKNCVASLTHCRYLHANWRVIIYSWKNLKNYLGIPIIDLLILPVFDFQIFFYCCLRALWYHSLSVLSFITFFHCIIKSVIYLVRYKEASSPKMDGSIQVISLDTDRANSMCQEA